MPLDPKRTVAELRELQELTGDADGAQRVAWTDTWVEAQHWLAGKLEPHGLDMEFDEAGNQWWTLPGRSHRELLLGGHLDSVPNGGWLDGSLNVVAGSEVLRRIAEEGEPPLAVRLERGRRLDARPGRAPSADRPGRSLAPRRARRARGRSRPRDRVRPPARQRGRLPRAAHRAGPGARVARGRRPRWRAGGRT